VRYVIYIYIYDVSRLRVNFSRRAVYKINSRLRNFHVLDLTNINRPTLKTKINLHYMQRLISNLTENRRRVSITQNHHSIPDA
jgi:hypothetical protein